MYNLEDLEELPAFEPNKVKRGIKDIWSICKSCVDKTLYKKPWHAAKVAKRFNQRIYHCERCGGYHLTKQVINDLKENTNQLESNTEEIVEDGI